MTPITITMLARDKGCATGTVRAAVVSGKLRATKVGNVWTIHAGDAKRWRPLAAGRPRKSSIPAGSSVGRPASR